MASQIIMPKLGLTMEEGSVGQWLKHEGDQVERGEPILVVTTDKADIEVEAQASGVLSKILVPEGVTVPVTQVIGWITQPGEAPPETDGAPAAPASSQAFSAPSVPAPGAPVSPSAAPSPSGIGAPRSTGIPAPVAPLGVMIGEDRPGGGRLKSSPAARRLARERGVDLALVKPSGPEGRIVEADVEAYLRQAPVAAAPVEAERQPISPLARRLAEEMGVDLARVTGTGPGGRIVKEDILRAAGATRTAAAPAAPAPPAAPALGEVTPLRGLRKAIADQMAYSARTAAHVTLFMDVDMTEAMNLRAQMAAEVERRTGGTRLSPTHVIVLAVAKALAEHPEVNATLTDEGIRINAEVNIGIATALPEGLVVPVMRNVDKKSIVQIAAEVAQLAQKARDRKLTQQEFTGGTFSITNLGMVDVDGFTPIINPPETAILGVGRVAAKPVVHDGQIVARQMMTLSLAFDHRVVDGYPAAVFLRRIKALLEEPYLLFLD